MPFRRACLAAWNDDIYLSKGCRGREREGVRGKEGKREEKGGREGERQSEQAFYLN